MFGVAFHGFEDFVRKLVSQCLAFVVDVEVVATAEVDSFEGAGQVFLGFDNLLYDGFARCPDNDGLSRQQFVDFFGSQVKGGLQHGALAGTCHQFVADVIECRTYAVRVAHGKEFAASRESAHHISAVEERHGSLQHIGDVHVRVDVVRNVRAFETLFLRLDEEPFHLAVETVPHDFEHDVGVAVNARTLSLGDKMGEHFADVRHVEVSAEAEVLCLPVVTAQEGVHIFQSATSGGGVSEMSHIEFTEEWWPFAGNVIGGGNFSRSVGIVSSHLPVDAGEDLGDGILAFGLFAVHILMSGLSVEFYAGHSGTFLSAVVLFLHHQIEFAEGIFVGTVFLPVVVQWFEQAHHCDAAFVFQGFHTVCFRDKSWSGRLSPYDRLSVVYVAKRLKGRFCHVAGAWGRTYLSLYAVGGEPSGLQWCSIAARLKHRICESGWAHCAGKL